MTTFDAIAHIRRDALSREQALLFLMENLGFSASYAGEILSVLFDDSDESPGPSAVAG